MTQAVAQPITEPAFLTFLKAFADKVKAVAEYQEDGVVTWRVCEAGPGLTFIEIFHVNAAGDEGEHFHMYLDKRYLGKYNIVRLQMKDGKTIHVEADAEAVFAIISW